MRKPFWTVARRKKAVGYVSFIAAYVISSVVVRSLLGPIADSGAGAMLPAVVGSIAGCAAMLLARVQYTNGVRRWLTRQAEKHAGPSSVPGGGGVAQFAHSMWWPLLDATRKLPSLLVTLANLGSRAPVPFSTSVPGFFERKARMIAASGVWDSVPEDRREDVVSAILSCTEDGEPETLRSLFSAGDLDSVLSYLTATQSATVAMNAIRTGIPVEYVKAAL